METGCSGPRLLAVLLGWQFWAVVGLTFSQTLSEMLTRCCREESEEKVKVNRCHFQSLLNKTWAFSFVGKSPRSLWICGHFEFLKFTTWMRRGALHKHKNATKYFMVYWCVVSCTYARLRLLSVALAKENWLWNRHLLGVKTHSENETVPIV